MERQDVDAGTPISAPDRVIYWARRDSYSTATPPHDDRLAMSMENDSSR